MRAGPRVGTLAEGPLAGDRGTHFEGGDDGPIDASISSDAGAALLDAGALLEATRVAAATESASTSAASAPTEEPTVTTTPRAARRARLRAEREARRTRARILGVPLSFHIPPQVLAQEPPITLPIAEPPATPAVPTTFAAREDDPAGRAAREIATLVPTFLNFRGIVPGAHWSTDSRRVWRIQPEADCLARLRAAHIDAVPFDGDEIVTPVPTPVEVRGSIGGVAIRTVRPGERVVLACELVARLPELTRVLRAHHVRALDVLSAYRPGPRQSFHTLGLALDVASFETDDGALLSVEEDFVETPSHETCDAPMPDASAARTLLEIACDLAGDHAFSSVLTPNYNEGHRNHFHLDARPDDPRFYVR
jgi:hypothetical protein